jgi:hypothetical protein
MPNYERQPSKVPWGGRQPRYTKLMRRGPREFYLVAPLPSGRLVEVRLGQISCRERPQP